MASDDALNAAKQAALQALLETKEAGIQSGTPAEAKVPPSEKETHEGAAADEGEKKTGRKRKQRRRKRKRGTNLNSTVERKQTPVITFDKTPKDVDMDDGAGTVDYEPEPIVNVLKRARIMSAEENKDDASSQMNDDDTEKNNKNSENENGDIIGIEDDSGIKELAEVMKRFETRGRVAEELDVDVEENESKPMEVDENEEKENVPDKEDERREEELVLENEKTNELYKGMSRKKWKEKRRLLISRLKSIVPDPSVIESWDITAQDPVLLGTLKSIRKSVSVPVNWRQKRKYLQNKRGLEKRIIALPSYIADLGVDVKRESQRESDSKKSLKQKQREKMRAKITTSSTELALEDEKRLRDAFFKFQTKPSLTGLGDVYYELRELEVDSKPFVPGVLSQTLRQALGMKADVGDVTEPVPWLIGMQRWGPPPGWPGLKVPGVNAPIPAGAKWGFAPNGWGKAPVDDRGIPLYGDVFEEGLASFQGTDKRFDESDSKKRWRWGRFRDVDDGDEDDEPVSVPVPKMEPEGDNHGTQKEVARQKERKDESWSGQEAQGAAPQDRPYQVLTQRKSWASQTGQVLGSAHTYDLPMDGQRAGADGGSRDRGSRKDWARSGGEESRRNTRPPGRQVGQQVEARESESRRR